MVRGFRAGTLAMAILVLRLVLLLTTVQIRGLHVVGPEADYIGGRLSHSRDLSELLKLPVWT